MKKIQNTAFLSYDELCIAIENDSVDNNNRTMAKSLLSAVTDWPTVFSREPRDLIAELKYVVKGKLTFNNVDKYRKSLRPENDSWKMEALSALLEMYDTEQNDLQNKTLELEDLILKITRHYKQ